MTTKQELHDLVEELPAVALPEAARLLQALRGADADPVLRAFLDAPEDDEPETDEERAATAEAYASIARGEIYSLDDIRREIGL